MLFSGEVKVCCSGRRGAVQAEGVLFRQKGCYSVRRGAIQAEGVLFRQKVCCPNIVNSVFKRWCEVHD